MEACCSSFSSLVCVIGVICGFKIRKENSNANIHYLASLDAAGAAKAKESPARLDAGRAAFKKLGVEIKDTYMTMGRYDLVCVIEAPNDESVAQALLTLGAQGNVQTETLKAWTEAEYRKITGSL